MVPQSSMFKAHPDVIETLLANGEIVLLHLETKTYFSLNETGARIWKLATADSTAGRISEELKAAYDVTEEDARKSVSALIGELTAAKLLIPNGDAV